MLSDPTPFEIVEADGVRVGSNGALVVQLLDADGAMHRRRGLSGISRKPAGEAALPLVNALAGDLLANPAMTPAELHARLAAVAGHVPDVPLQRHEWLVCSLGDVHVYVLGQRVIVTRADLAPGQV